MTHYKWFSLIMAIGQLAVYGMAVHDGDPIELLAAYGISFTILFSTHLIICALDRLMRELST